MSILNSRLNILRHKIQCLPMKAKEKATLNIIVNYQSGTSLNHPKNKLSHFLQFHIANAN